MQAVISYETIVTDKPEEALPFVDTSGKLLGGITFAALDPSRSSDTFVQVSTPNPSEIPTQQDEDRVSTVISIELGSNGELEESTTFGEDEIIFIDFVIPSNLVLI